MSDDMREVVCEIIRYDWGREPEGGYTSIWFDQSPRNSNYGDRHFFMSYTPPGVYAVYRAFVRRMRSPQQGESKRRIKRDIQTNPHLHPRLKRELLRGLVKAAVRYNGRGLRAADASFARRIMALQSIEEADVIRLELEAHPFMPAYLRENLLYNLQTYAARLIPPVRVM